MFALGTFARGVGAPFVGFVFDQQVVAVDAMNRLFNDTQRGNSALAAASGMNALLDEWDRNFDALQALAASITAEGLSSHRLLGAVSTFDDLRVLPTILRPSKILNCASNYSGHLAEMRKYAAEGGGVAADKLFKGDKNNGRPYFFLKAPSSLNGAFDDIVMPSLADQIDWEAELAVAIGRRSKHVKAERALDCIAGYMTFNDISCRNLLWREDRPQIRSDWLSSKSFDTFGPLGPIFVPRAFVPDHGKLRLVLKVNGETKQDGLAGEMIYSPEEQIEYCSRMMTLEPGDVFATGTLAGVGQGTGTFLKPGDILETEVVGIGKQRNKIVGPLDH